MARGSRSRGSLQAVCKRRRDVSGARRTAGGALLALLLAVSSAAAYKVCFEVPDFPQIDTHQSPLAPPPAELPSADGAAPAAPEPSTLAPAVPEPTAEDTTPALPALPTPMGCSAPKVQPPRGMPAPPVTISNGQFMAGGKEVQLHGVNWFGFNARATYLHGLWVGQASANSDFAAIIWQFKLLGFNTVRLPFLFEDLYKTAEVIGGYCTHQSSLQELAQRTIDPEFSGAVTKATPVPPVKLPDVSQPGSCNTYIPPSPGATGLSLDRYLWTVQWLVANGFYVMIDWHPMGMEKTSYVLADFVHEWKKVWTAVTCLPNFEADLKGRVFVDLFNEPDSQWQAWQPKDGKAGMTELYLNAMDALWAISPGSALFVVEGGGQGAAYGLNWGNGFITDKNVIKEFGISDANPFFSSLLKKPYLNSVVISPHIYGPSVSSRKDWYKGHEWMLSLDKAFGYLSQAPGYCADSKCHVFPTVVGEFGSRFKDPEDLAHLEDLALYLTNQGAGKTGGHAPVDGWMYWCYNANSGDTGGLVDDSWMQWEWRKLRYLRKLGLKPWYA